MVNSEPRVFKNIKVFTGHHGITAANAFIKNLTFMNVEPGPPAGIFASNSHIDLLYFKISQINIDKVADFLDHIIFHTQMVRS